MLLSFAEFLSTVGRGSLYLGIIVLMLLIALWKKEYTWRIFAWKFYTFWVLGTYINQSLKWSFQHPRPWWHTADLIPLGQHISSGFGMPSGHAQSACGLWLMIPLLSYYKKTISPLLYWSGVLLCLIWPCLMAWSRVILHAHSMSQVMVGICCGLVWWGFIEYATKKNKLSVYILGVLLSLCIFRTVYDSHYGVEIPQAWLNRIILYLPGFTEQLDHQRLYPKLIKNMFLSLGSVMSIFYILTLRRRFQK